MVRLYGAAYCIFTVLLKFKKRAIRITIGLNMNIANLFYIGEVGYYITQLFSAHGYFWGFLHKMGKTGCYWYRLLYHLCLQQTTNLPSLVGVWDRSFWYRHTHGDHALWEGNMGPCFMYFYQIYEVLCMKLMFTSLAAWRWLCQQVETSCWCDNLDYR